MLTINRLESIRTLEAVVLPYLGKFSNGAPAIHLEHASLPSDASLSGCLVSMDADYITRGFSSDFTNTKKIRGIWRVTIIQYNGSDRAPNTDYTRDFFDIKLTLMKHFEDVVWQPSIPLRGTFPRAIALIGFEQAIAMCA